MDGQDYKRGLGNCEVIRQIGWFYKQELKSTGIHPEETKLLAYGTETPSWCR